MFELIKSLECPYRVPANKEKEISRKKTNTSVRTNEGIRRVKSSESKMEGKKRIGLQKLCEDKELKIKMEMLEQKEEREASKRRTK